MCMSVLLLMAVELAVKVCGLILRTAPSFDTMVNTLSKSLLSTLVDDEFSVNFN